MAPLAPLLSSGKHRQLDKGSTLWLVFLVLLNCWTLPLSKPGIEGVYPKSVGKEPAKQIRWIDGWDASHLPATGTSASNPQTTQSTKYVKKINSRPADLEKRCLEETPLEHLCIGQLVFTAARDALPPRYQCQGRPQSAILCIYEHMNMYIYIYVYIVHVVSGTGVGCCNHRSDRLAMLLLEINSAMQM